MKRLQSALRVSAWAAMLLIPPTAGAFGQSSAPAGEAQVKAAFLYNFLRFVEWPANTFATVGDSLIVAIVGSGPSADAAATFLVGKTIGNRGIAVRLLKGDGVDADGAITGIHAVFVGTTDARRARRVLDAIADDGVLSIGDSFDFAASGGTIGLLVDANKVRFDINTERATAARLKISSKLLALARILHTGKPRRLPL